MAGVLAIAAVALGAASPVLHRTSWTGASQRALWAVLLAWASVAALALMSNADRDVSARSAPDVTIEA